MLPSAGQLYAGAGLTRGFAVRTLGVAATVAGGVTTLSSMCFVGCSGTGGGGDQIVVGLGLLIVGAGALAAGTIDDIVSAPRHVREHNARLLRDVAVVPMIQDGGGTLVLAGRW